MERRDFMKQSALAAAAAATGGDSDEPDCPGEGKGDTGPDGTPTGSRLPVPGARPHKLCPTHRGQINAARQKTARTEDHLWILLRTVAPSPVSRSGIWPRARAHRRPQPGLPERNLASGEGEPRASRARPPRQPASG